MQRKLILKRIKNSLSVDCGLDIDEVELRRIKYGSNDILETRENPWLEILKETLSDPMIWFLISTSILFFVLKNYNQGIILLLATIPLILMDAFLHWRTQASTSALSSTLASEALVIRNGLKINIQAREIVPGDLVLVVAGNHIPADGIVLEEINLQVDESTLTGESFPAHKKILNDLSFNIDSPEIDYQHWCFAGTRVLTGTALIRIVYVGKETLYGEIVVSALQATQEKTPLQTAIIKLIYVLIFVATFFCILLAIIRYYQGFGVVDAILSAATLAVAALPDEFPVVFTFFLGLGVYRLARRNALVRRAVSVENIGRITTICSDKTGTLTQGKLKFLNSSAAGKFNEAHVLYVAAVASRTESSDPLDLAILKEIDDFRVIIPERIFTFPFTEDRKRETTFILSTHQKILVASKGAPEKIISMSNLTKAEKENWLKNASNYSAAGCKVIACAQLECEKKPEHEPQENYQFVGLLIFSDPPRKEVFDAVQRCLSANIHILMLTGDHPETARAIALEIGIGKGDPKVVLAQDAEKYWKEGNGSFFKTIDVVARAIPSQKLSIVTVLQSIGEIVAATGDGVNDVPALKAADVGVAMGERGSQSAREVSDIILLDDNFSSIVNAISEGRQLFKNLQFSFKYLFMIHIPFVISAAIIPLLGYPLLYYPIHIVWIELIIHPTAMLVFQDLPQSDKLEPIKQDSKIHLFSKKDILSIILVGIVSTACVVLGDIIIVHFFNDERHARAFVLASLGLISTALTIGLSKLKTRVSQVIVGLTIISSVTFVQLPVISEFLSMGALRYIDWSVILATSVIIFILARI